MEGREQKHQMLAKYSKNTTHQCCWPKIFRHKFIQLVHLQLNGYDTYRYCSRGIKYIADTNDSSCNKCSLRFSLGESNCKLCDSRYMKQIVENMNGK